MKDAERDAWTKKVTKDAIQRSLARSKSKYNSRQKEVHGHVFDSAREADHYLLLAMRQGANEISDLQLQPAFPIIINGVSCGEYRADFSYIEAGSRVIEDSKGFRTPVYRLKKKLVEALYAVKIIEV